MIECRGKASVGVAQNLEDFLLPYPYALALPISERSHPVQSLLTYRLVMCSGILKDAGFLIPLYVKTALAKCIEFIFHKIL